METLRSWSSFLGGALTAGPEQGNYFAEFITGEMCVKSPKREDTCE